MKSIRQSHFYLGLFFAPSIIFFAFTGALQTFSLHEDKVPGSHHPEWIAKLAEIHKDQRLPEAKPKSPAVVSPVESPKKIEIPTPATKGAAARRNPSMPLKIFVLFMAIGLISSSLLGIYMAFRYNRDRRIIWALLSIGTLLPVALLYL
jgi:hypothetical protein